MSAPLTFAGAGLPQLPIGELIGSAACEALVEPARQEQVDFDQRAVDEIITYTDGYPYFIQEFGRAVWDIADGPTTTFEDARSARGVVEMLLRSWGKRQNRSRRYAPG